MSAKGNKREMFNEISDKLRASLVLDKNTEKIKNVWVEKIRAYVFAAQDQTSPVLVNSLGIFLNELILILKENRPPAELGQRGMSVLHGAQRARFRGYFLPQLLMEFTLLRETIVETLYQEGVLSFDVYRTIHASIDSMISLAATEFAKVQQEKLTEALNKAEMSNRDLEHFAAIAAHDLKSPLATIAGLLTLLQDEFNGRISKQGKEYLELIQTVSGRMRDLIDRLLDYARLSNTKTSFQVIDLEELLMSVQENLGDLLQKTGTLIQSAPLPSLPGDRTLLGQLFQNLIANAVKFSGNRAPAIAIRVEEKDAEWLFIFKDQGIGFDPKYREEIFALYKKLHGDGEYQGAGLGLATCRKIVELHGGLIWAESELGSGSTFYFTLSKNTPPT